jgi:hypothetical protein
MLNYSITFTELYKLTEQQLDFLFYGLVWYGKIKIHERDQVSREKWGKLGLMIGNG